MPLSVIIPVNRLERAKGRLSEVLTADERRELTLLTLDTVVGAVSDAGLIPVILSADETLRVRFGAVQVMPERPDRRGLSDQLEAAVAGEEEVLILHGDLPLVTGRGLARLAAAAGHAPSATLVRSRDGGTNAMLLRPTGQFALKYGPGSFALHDSAARDAGLAVVHHRDAALALDLDTPDDLLLLLTMDPGDRCQATRYLRPLDLPRRIAAQRSTRSPR